MAMSAHGGSAQSDEERDAWAVLASADGVGAVGFMRLIQRHGSASAVLEIARRPSGAADLVSASRRAAERPEPEDDEANPRREWLSDIVADAIVAAALNSSGLLGHLHTLGVTPLTIDDPGYPARLLGVDQPPPLLFVRGDARAMSADRAVAVVGTRRPTDAGRRLATQISREITRAGGVVVSGLAAGIDGAAHEAAVNLDRPTVAVLGSGHARLYPAMHRGLADRIVRTGGCVISELAPDVSGNRGTFPRRNRILSGLADATVVVEAPRHSGALITADWALAQGRECFLLPGPLDARVTEGNLRYLRGYHGQARIVVSVPLLLEDLGFDVEVRPRQAIASLLLGETEATVAALVEDGQSTVDGLVLRTQLPVSTVLSALTLLELRGLVTAAYGRYRPVGALLPAIEGRRGSRNMPEGP